MPWYGWLLIGVGALVLAFAVVDARWPNRLRALERGMGRTDSALERSGQVMSGLGYTLTALVTLPVLGFILLGWIGLVLGLVIGVLLSGNRHR